jgi:hypothetical protein
MLRDQLEHLGCRNDTLVIAISNGTNSNLFQNLINFRPRHSISSANVLENVLDPIGGDGGVGVILTRGGGGLYDV